MQSSLSFKPEVQAAVGGKPKNRRLKWTIIVGFWTFFGLLNASQLYFGLLMEGMHLPVWRVLGMYLLGWWAWIPATPIRISSDWSTGQTRFQTQRAGGSGKFCSNMPNQGK